MISTDNSPGRLLFVDDEVNILKSLKREFIPLGYEVEVAESGAAALELLKTHEFDVIVSDMRMPEMNGAEFLKQAYKLYPDTRRILLTGYSEIDAAISAINEGKIHCYLNKPWKESELEVAIGNAIETKRLQARNIALEAELTKQNAELKDLNQNLEQKVEKRTQQVKAAFDELKKTHQSTIEVFSTLIQMFEGPNKGQCQQVADISRLIAKKLELSDEDTQAVYFASLLHSIGKIGLPPSIVEKPYHLLAKDDIEIYQRYPLLGETALMTFEPLQHVSATIGAHKEYYNGKGFPAGLKGDEIPLLARIVNVAVEYIELRRGQINKEPLNSKQAIKFIHENDGVRYDPKVVQAFDQITLTLPDIDGSLEEVMIFKDEIKVGMMLTRDCLTENGMKLLSKGLVLNRAHIEKLKKLPRLPIYVQP